MASGDPSIVPSTKISDFLVKRNQLSNVRRRPTDHNCNVTWMASKLSESGCLSLGQILGSFSAPISEEHAWAVTYETLKTLDVCLQNRSVMILPTDGSTIENFCEATSPADVLIHKDGYVSTNSFIISNSSYSKKRSKRKTPISTENKAVAEIGLVIFASLDYGLGEGEERLLSPQMEMLLDLMTSANSVVNPVNEREFEPEDEGIEQDEDEDMFKRSGICRKILKECENHLSMGSEAESHYKAVCRALIQESLELTSFMEKIKSADTTDASEEIKELALQDWARLWVQVLRDMRTGVKLKKVNFSKTPVEYEMTPYEILMDDIKYRRYKLNKVTTDDSLPSSVKKDAHDIILEFIRSRPPLKPASERSLAPLRKESTPIELLMEDIRSDRARTHLRKTGGPPPKTLLMRLGSSSSTMESSRTKLVEGESGDETGRGSSPRRKVTVDPSTMSNLLNFSDSEDDFDDDLSGDENLIEDHLNGGSRRRRRISVATLLSRQTSVESTATLDDDFICYVRKQEQNHKVEERGRKSSMSETRNRNNWKKKMVHDLAIHGSPSPAKKSDLGRSRSRHQRRNSVTVCETPAAPKQVQDQKNLPELSKPKSEQQQQQPKLQKQPQRLSSQTSVKSDKPKKVLITASFPSTTSGSSSSSASSSRSSSRSSTPKRISPVKSAKQQKVDTIESFNDDDLINKPQMHANLHAEFMQSEHWATALQTLDLTLDEVIHIRSVLTKAELESLPLDGTLKEDVEKGKVCFLCMKTRFGFFSRGNKCELCKQQVCNKCSAKMRIPLEHFSTMPVFTLQPTDGSNQNPTETDGPSASKFFSVRKRGASTLGVPSGLWSSNTAGSAPTSPSFSRKFSSPTSNSGPSSCFAPIVLQKSQMMTSSLTSFVETEDEYADDYGPKSFNCGPTSLQPNNSSLSYFKRSSKARNSLRERLEGSVQTVCIDCREMVLQVIRAQTTAQRLQMAKSFFQNLNT